MSDWDKYKTTFNLSDDIFTLARRGDVHSLKGFLSSNPMVDINKKNQKSHSPLMISVYNGNHEVSRVLLERGADPNSTDFSGNTVLMGAAFKGDMEMVILLVNQGAILDQRNHDGATAEQWARAFGRSKVVSFLSPNVNHSKFPNIKLAVKVFWGFLKPKLRKEVTI